jgi:hypothetical protein
MAEPLFGSVSPMWTAMPPPVFGWFPGPTPAANPPLGVAPPDVAVPPGPTQFPTFPAFAASGMVMVPTASALLNAVAVRRGQPLGPTNDSEIEDFIYDVLDLWPGVTEVDVRCEGGRTTLTGTVSHKRLKRDVGEIAWAIPGVSDVQNNIAIAARRRSRTSSRESESPPVAAGRKSA